MALWFTNSLFRTKSFGFRSLLPPLISLPTTTTRTVIASNGRPNGKSQTTPELTTISPPKRPKDDKKSKPKTMFEKAKMFLTLRNHKLDIGWLRLTIKNLTPSPLIVFAEEARKLEKQLGEAAMGNAFLLQASDRFDGSSEELNADTLRVILQMNAVLMFGGQMPVIKVGNQFAKPRLDTSKEKKSVKLDNLNGDASNQRLIKAYPPRTGGYAAMQRVAQWDLDFMKDSEHGDRYRELASQVDKALGFMSAAGHAVDHATDFWTSHEYFPCERSLIAYKDSTSSLSYDCSSHFLWVGERTCQLDGAHVKFLKKISNPLGIKVSDKMDPKELVKLIGILNPENKPGRITIITRMGAENIKVKLPNIVREVQRADQIVTWVTDPDPMPRNTISSSLKPHPFDAIKAEVRAFFDVHEQEESYPGGVHLEMTGQNNTKVNNGSKTTTFDNTHCDPVLNASQSLELAFIIAERLQKQRITM